MWLSLTRPKTAVDHVPAPVVASVSVRLRRRTRGLDRLLSLVFVAAKMLPLGSALRSMWSSGLQPVGMALTPQSEARSPAPSVCTANHRWPEAGEVVVSCWLHMAPMWPLNAIRDEMSPELSAG